jgi:hypothetical protein
MTQQAFNFKQPAAISRQIAGRYVMVEQRHGYTRVTCFTSDLTHLLEAAWYAVHPLRTQVRT